MAQALGCGRALPGVDLHAQPGSITAVMHPNGAGNTPLFHTIPGFYRPTKGSIRIKGQEIEALCR